jgi:hypothetical protein
MNRRRLLLLGVGMAAAMLAGSMPATADLEPDAMWLIYRRYALFIVAQRGDGAAAAVVDLLARALPLSRARLARAADVRRVGVLIGTHQQDVAIMDIDDAKALFLAKPPFADVRDLPLRVIVSFGEKALVCRADFPARQCFLLARTLVAHGEALPEPARAPEGVIPAHPGALAFFAGKEIPA